MPQNRSTKIEIDPADFRKIGHQLVDDIADLYASLPEMKITAGEGPKRLKEILGDQGLPEEGSEAEDLIKASTELLFAHSLFNGHPKFYGYITSSATPIGALADFLAAAVNANCGAQLLSPIATEIEKQTIGWLAEFIGVSPESGGILVSGGNAANFTAFLAARTAMAPKAVKQEGIGSEGNKLCVYCCKTTHTWIEKAAVLFGLGTNAIQWIDAKEDNTINEQALEKAIISDLAAGKTPMMIVGTAGDVSTGAVDDLRALAELSQKYKVWFHVDGAYGAPAAILPECKAMFNGLEQADSIALDPHKWLYSPLEAGCTLVKNPQHLIDTYSSHPEYYNFEKGEHDSSVNFYEYGLQNSRGFRALKVWLGLQQLGRSGYVQLIREDIALAEMMFELADKHEAFEAVSCNLSIATFRFVPTDLGQKASLDYLNELNEALVDQLQLEGKVFPSNAIVGGKYCLRACVVNFRTRDKDVEESMEIILKTGKALHAKLKETTNHKIHKS